MDNKKEVSAIPVTREFLEKFVNDGIRRIIKPFLNSPLTPQSAAIIEAEVLHYLNKVSALVAGAPSPVIPCVLQSLDDPASICIVDKAQADKWEKADALAFMGYKRVK